MKRAGYLTERIADADNLLYAYYKAMRGKRMQEEVLRFSSGLQENIALLRRTVLSGEVDVGNYTYFQIRDPKPRLICAAAFHERVLHHAIMNVCHPYFERQLIETTYATRPQKGVYQAIDRAKRACCRYGYVAKFDFRKYFDSIDHDILKVLLRKLFKDKHLLGIFDMIIDSYSRMTGKGIPIGNLTSQYFANYYLSGLDHYVKEELRVKEYVRYMDDFLIFAETEEKMDKWVKAVRRYACDRLALTLKSVIRLCPLDGVPFLGYTLYPHKILLNGRSKRRLKLKMRDYEFMLENDLWSDQCYLEHITPLLAFARYGYTRHLRQGILG